MPADASSASLPLASGSESSTCVAPFPGFLLDSKCILWFPLSYPQTRAILECGWVLLTIPFVALPPARGRMGEGNMGQLRQQEQCQALLPKGPTPQSHLGPIAPWGAIPGREVAGTGLAFANICFCASLESQEEKKGNSFQVDGEHAPPGGITGQE